MASTSIRLTTDYQVFHTVATDNDMPETDIDTIDANVQNLTGEGEFIIEASSTNVAYTTAHKVQDTTEAAITSSAAIGDFLYIKHTGFTDADKTTETASTTNLTVGVGGAFAAGGFTLAPGEAICFHGLGGGSDDINDWQLDSSSGNIYVEVVYK